MFELDSYSDLTPEMVLFLGVLEFIITLVIDWYAIVLAVMITLLFIPAVILILFYAVAVFLYAYRRQHIDQYRQSGSWKDHFWNSARLSISTFLVLLGRFWHAHDVVGLENIPDKGPALLVFYHGTLPIDVYYCMAHIRRFKRRRLKIIVDHFMFQMPALKILLDVFGCFTGPATECVNTLRRGHLLAICPGGVREAIFASDNYECCWNKRTGFAKVALAARVPIVPVFTSNCRESFKTVKTGQTFLRWLYEKTRLPFVIYYGGFPVKMRTYFGERIGYSADVSPAELAAKVEQCIQQLVARYQRTPGSVLGGLQDRLLGCKE